MRFLTTSKFTPPPMVRIKRRKMVSDITTGTLEITETIIELTLPSFWQGLKDKATSVGNSILDAFGSFITPRIYAV